MGQRHQPNNAGAAGELDQAPASGFEHAAVRMSGRASLPIPKVPLILTIDLDYASEDR
jgi:hypothetical protein